METIITLIIVLGAGLWLLRWLRGKARGEGGCGCGKCAKNCSTPSKLCLKTDKE